MDQPDVTKEFQRRRKVYFRKSVPAIGLMIVGFLPILLQGGKRWVVPPDEFFKPMLELVFAGAGIVWWALLTLKFYRCPVCNSVPMGGWSHAGTGGIGFSRGVNLNPDKCPKCGAILK